MTNLTPAAEAMEAYETLVYQSDHALLCGTTEKFIFENTVTIREALSLLDQTQRETGQVHTIDHDGFTGEIIGHYKTREGKEGVVMQQIGTRVVHVYGRKWLKDAAPAVAEGE